MSKSRVSSGVMESLMLAPGAVVAGAAREIVGATINPTWKGVPVAQQAYVMDGVGVAIGAGLEVLGALLDQPMLANLGKGVWVPSLAYLSQNATHDTRRKMNKTQVTATAPQRVMMAQQADAIPANVSGQSFRPALSEDF